MDWMNKYSPSRGFDDGDGERYLNTPLSNKASVTVLSKLWGRAVCPLLQDLVLLVDRSHHFTKQLGLLFTKKRKKERKEGQTF